MCDPSAAIKIIEFTGAIDDLRRVKTSKACVVPHEHTVNQYSFQTFQMKLFKFQMTHNLINNLFLS